MTDEEAAGKWCPMGRSTTGNRFSYGSGAEPDKPEDRRQYAHEMAALMPCIGSACMAWRFAEPELGNVIECRPAVGIRPEGRDWGYNMKEHQWTRHEVVEHGYCGLAGKP